MTIVIDRTEAEVLLRKAVEVKGGEHVQTTCVYLVGGEFGWADGDEKISAGCIVGTAVVEKVGIEKAAELFAAPNDDEKINEDILPNILPNEDTLPNIIETLNARGFDLTHEARRLWSDAQRAQDGNADAQEFWVSDEMGGYSRKATWQEALDFALSRNA